MRTKSPDCRSALRGCGGCADAGLGGRRGCASLRGVGPGRPGDRKRDGRRRQPHRVFRLWTVVFQNKCHPVAWVAQGRRQTFDPVGIGSWMAPRETLAG